MSKLTLPIVIGRQYQRRDGKVITTEPSDNALVAVVRHDAELLRDGSVYLKTGRYASDYRDYPADLVADYIEPEPVDAELPKGFANHVHTDVSPGGFIHPHYMALRWIADGLPVQRNIGGRGWTTQSPITNLRDIAEGAYPSGDFRLEPKTIRIGEFDVPEPLREAPAEDAKVYLAVTAVVKVFPMGELDHDCDRWRYGNLGAAGPQLITLGLLHDTREGAMAHRRALLSFTSTTTGAPS